MFSGVGIIFSIIAIAAMIIMIYVLVRMPATKHYGMLLATIKVIQTYAKSDKKRNHTKNIQ